MYSAFARKLFEANSSQEAANEIKILIDKLKARRPSLDEFKVAFKEVVYTKSNSKQRSLVRYILREFSTHNSYKYPVDFDDLTVEHLQPQSRIDIDGWTANTIGSLGNLIFLDQETNEKLADKAFDVKKQLLVQDGYSLPNFIFNSDTWEPSDVEEHTEQMAEAAYNTIWKI